MVAQAAAPAIPRLSLPANPSVHASADVHEFSFIEGEVRVGAGVVIAPGTAVTAESGASVVVGEGCLLLPGVIVEGIAGAQVVTPSGYTQSGYHTHGHTSVWVGDRTVVSHKSIIHSPAFIGEGCFIGFRSTVFNARIGDGCVVMMHTLIQDVEIPPGRCVPSGSIITSQHQADQLPKVRPEDFELAQEIVGTTLSKPFNKTIGKASSSGPNASGPSRSTRSKLIPIHSRSSFTSAQSAQSATQSATRPTTRQSSYATEGEHMQAQRLSPEIVQQVRQHLSQGYRIGMEHADQRRYRSGVWETCTPIKDTREQAVFEALERCLAEHSGEYVRMFGIDPAVKRRVGMTTVQRPGDQPAPNSQSSTVGSGSASYGASSRAGYSDASNSSTQGMGADILQEVRNLLRSGHIIGTEHADARHYRSNVWKSCSPISSPNEQEVISRLQHCLNEHSGEYVRMFGIDPKAKRRTANKTIQRADGKPIDISPSKASAVGNAYGQSSSGQGGYASAGSSPTSSGNNNSEVSQAVHSILSQGGQLGIETADARRYRSGIWQTAPSVQSVSQLQNFLSQNTDKYVRVFSINKAMKTRGSATTVQKPNQAGNIQSTGSNSRQGHPDPINANPPHYDDPAFLKSGRNSGGSGYGNSHGSSNGGYGNPGGNNGNGAVDSEVMNQVTQLVNQGCRIAVEFADKRRFRSGIWQTGPAIEARRPAEAISALGQQLAQHPGDYVRLVGVDPVAKRRVLETTIQRP
ncbi:MAG: carbon dioxide concentrating mechanism protein CcmM [Phormidesmis priestleyi Ana]|uniref:Carbon dioxide concentrating mechanism protein CcmM n=1 Tax=Phormidesmis priestleyi Ana TaxID=1666911 RepID=A0A0P7YTW3_9CYAN|nr:MAG: carbon dioxide concentrating mechanism protein CcmM [Phormidesmis priestleyi Ana]